MHNQDRQSGTSTCKNTQYKDTVLSKLVIIAQRFNAQVGSSMHWLLVVQPKHATEPVMRMASR